MSEQMFKAWDNKNKKWLKSDDIYIDCDGMVCLDEGEYDFSLVTVDATLCRSTGFKGLFEFDIIRDHNGIGLIKYSAKCGCFKVYYVGEMEGKCKYFMDYNIRGEFESIERIGNIFEHKHLLEAKQ